MLSYATDSCSLVPCLYLPPLSLHQHIFILCLSLYSRFYNFPCSYFFTLLFSSPSLSLSCCFCASSHIIFSFKMHFSLSFSPSLPPSLCVSPPLCLCLCVSLSSFLFLSLSLPP